MLQREAFRTSWQFITGMWTPTFASPLTDIRRDVPPRTTMSHDSHSSTQPAVRMRYCYLRGSLPVIKVRVAIADKVADGHFGFPVDDIRRKEPPRTTMSHDGHSSTQPAVRMRHCYLRGMWTVTLGSPSTDIRRKEPPQTTMSHNGHESSHTAVRMRHCYLRGSLPVIKVRVAIADKVADGHFGFPVDDIRRKEPPRTTMSHDGHSSTQPAVRMRHCYLRGMWTVTLGSPSTDIRRKEPPQTTMSHNGHESSHTAVRMRHCYLRGSV
ncbi:hypothetical protein T01_4592 [Trichinella spiralis]|uniref:Uncharacterized protein n=1 Tax=Trichinella spiralis TaxID=6334 RepID=A0A0V1B090_TRISP|nr:hypothetical protein T01_4592 [Trichinella spiralis]